MELEIRPGGPEDADAVLALFEEAMAWLVERGQTGQWGTEPWSARPAAVERVGEWARGGGLRLAIALGVGEPVGALVLGSRPPWVEPVEVEERYIEALVTSRGWAGRDVGGALIRAAAAEAAGAGAALLRVDCWAGAPALVAWYERQGFVRSGTFTMRDGWTGQVFALELRGGPGRVDVPGAGRGTGLVLRDDAFDPQ